jgi:hypothetical protein
MIKIILALLIFGIGTPCFSEESQRELKEWQIEHLQYFMNGSVNLLSDEPWKALENFQQAASLIEKTDEFSFASGFLVSFGQAIAFDVLGFTEQCRQSVCSMIFAINRYGDEDTSIRLNRNPPHIEESDEIINFLRNLAAIAPSRDVRELLFSFVDQIAEEISPAFEFGESAVIGNANWGFDYGKNNASVELCKSWWKKLKQWGKEICEFLGIIHEGCKKANEIKKQINELKAKNQPLPSGYNHYINPNARIQ